MITKITKDLGVKKNIVNIIGLNTKIESKKKMLSINKKN